MDLNPYAADLRRCTDALSAAEDGLRRARADKAELDGGPDPRADDLMAARARLTACQQEAAEAQERFTAAQRALAAWEANPPPPKHHSAWKYGLIGAGVVAAVAAGGGAIYALYALSDLAVGAVVGAVAGGAAGGGLGAVTAKDSNQREKQISQRAFDERRALLKRALDQARGAVEAAVTGVANAQAAIARLEQDINDAAARRAALNPDAVEAALTVADAERARCVAERTTAQARFDVMEEQIGPLRDQIERLSRELQLLDRHWHIARDFDEALNADGARKGRIHQACRDHFEEMFPDIASQPRKIADALQKQVLGKERGRKKLADEAADLARVHILGIRRVVFDGNNLCYSGNKFVGLPPLAAACRALRTQGYEVLVVFDPNPGARLRLPRGTRTALSETLGSDVAIRVAAKGTKADDVVLGEARDSQSAAVSNDFYQEARAFPGRYPALTEERVFPHTIVAPRGDSPGQIEIKAFGVFAIWT